MSLYDDTYHSLGNKMMVYRVERSVPDLPKVFFATADEFRRFAQSSTVSDIFCYELSLNIDDLLSDKGIKSWDNTFFKRDLGKVNFEEPLIEGMYTIEDRVVYQFEQVSNYELARVLLKYLGEEYKDINLQKLLG